MEEVEVAEEEGWFDALLLGGVGSNFFCCCGSRARFFPSRRRARKSIALSSSSIALVSVFSWNSGGAMVSKADGFHQAESRANTGRDLSR